MRKLLPTLLVLLAGLLGAMAQDGGAPAEPPGVRITFLPPPMEGTLSLGLYNKAGKLVRVLKSEAEEKDFTVGLNGLITFWDGKDDSGAVVPAGNYTARGFSVGSLDIEGVAYFCNDWISDEDSPRIVRILRSGVLLADGGVQLPVQLADGKMGTVTFALANKDGANPPPVFTETPIAKAAAENLPDGAESSSGEGDAALAFGVGKLWRKNGGEWKRLPLADLEHPVDAALGQETVWVIDATQSGTEVREYALTGELLRALTVPKDEPLPRWIAARGRDEILLVEEAANVQRVRVLKRETGGTDDKADRPISTWRTLAAKSIYSAPSFEAAAGHLGRKQPFKPEAKIGIRLVPNPLFKDAGTNVSLEIVPDKLGAILKTVDGLPLLRLTESKGLKWAVMGRETGSKAITIFQGDGSVVEEFRAGKLANMMAFDAGDYEWNGK